MTPSEYRELKAELRYYEVETETEEYDDYNINNIDVSGSKGTLMCLVSELNEKFPELNLGERDIQETGSSCLLRFSEMEDFEV